jgi:hypothetical protein
MVFHEDKELNAPSPESPLNGLLAPWVPGSDSTIMGTPVDSVGEADDSVGVPNFANDSKPVNSVGVSGPLGVPNPW